jgi:predicted nuclease with TOPRIM domain
LEAEVARREAEDLSPRLKSLEEERATLLEERRLVAKRVEDLIAKLGQLEKSLHA